jgi:DNA repair protein RadA/Sms
VIDPQTVLFGEVGLTGEVRAVSQPELRVNEAARLGFNRCVLPKSSLKNIDAPEGMQLIGVRHASEALDAIFI